ncbi:hypothetical protein SLS56_008445 [Neofusicoccum ribis]|uniref:Nephrocystin 3-like N-terminal domain-containing protein n=1 Tax=Neofusicoccum ribis TaxID=45134 RepID=A0ABR3SK37_9PEZI
MGPRPFQDSEAMPSDLSRKREDGLCGFEMRFREIFQDPGFSWQPLVLIGHSLGGILVKEAVIQMQHGSTEDKENLASIQGLVFFGVPNRGMEVASFVSMVGDNPNRFLLDVLRTTSGVMQRQSNEFQSTFTTKSASIYSVFETMLSPTAQLDQSGQYKMTGPPALLVGEDSAKCGRSWESDAKYAFAINRTHSELVKFRGPHDKEYAKVSRCLKSLTPRVGHKAEKHIKQMEHRLHGIEKAHAQTFAWLLAKPCDSSDERRRESARNSFLNWFKAANKEPIFWITGKPASGKSTLMKYIYHKDELKALLRSWALGRDPILVGHFFFDRGLSPLQKSRNGLFRSLLHQILSQRRDLVPIVFESYMKQSKLRSNKPIAVDVEHAKLEFTWNDLAAAFEKTIEMITSTEYLCIFVDGLDEYRKINDTESYATYLSEAPKNHQDVEVAPKGHKELCKMFKDLGRFPNLKICLASRPLNAFEHAFDVYSQLRLHDLSYHDVRTFVRDGLESHPLLLLVHGHSRDMEKDLIDTISNNAAGVFLWVKIVVQNVLDGLDERNFLNFNEIIRMIQSLPVELGGPEGLYMRMLRDVPSQHRAEGVNLLNIMLAAHNKELDLTSTTLQYTQWAVEDAIRQPVQKLSSEQMENAKALSDGHIKSRCRGLIEERYDQMEFLHQTVKEFVETIMEWDEIKAWGDEERMKKTNVPLLISTLLEIKLMIAMEDHRADLIRQMLSLAFYAEHTAGVSQTALLDDLDSKMQSSWGLTVENALENPQAQVVIQNSSWTTWFRWIENPFMEYSPLAPVWHKEGFYQLAILAGLRGYVHQKIKDGLIGLDLNWGEPILAFALFPWEIDSQPDLVSLIIDNGGDPQAKMLCGNTVWQRFIADLAFTSFPHSDEMIEIVILLLKAGADVASWGISTPGSAKDSVVQSSPAFEIIEFFSHHDLDILPLLIALVDAGALLLEDEEQMLRISLTPKQLQEVESLGRFQKTPDMALGSCTPQAN